MAQRVAVPEKTLEHWASQYIAYRFRSKAAIWWPARGEDIDLNVLPARPGKAIQIELKSATPSGRFQDVKVDLGQLWEYSQRPLWEQPFYVFPRPDWEGNLAECSRRNRKLITELGVARSGRGWWFADWMIVLTTADVCRVLAGPLDSHGSSRRGDSPARLVRFEPATNAAYWGSDGRATPPVPLEWLAFWDRLLRCGAAAWPQMVRVSANQVGDRSYFRHKQLLELLHSSLQSAEDGNLVTFIPDGIGGYESYGVPEPSSFFDVESGADQEGIGNHRIVVYLDSTALVQP